MGLTLTHSVFRFIFLVGVVGFLASCSSTDVTGSLGAKSSESFALAVNTRLQPTATPKAVQKQTSTNNSKSAAKAKIAAAKIQADRDAKRLADFDKMLSGLPEAQHKYFEKQRASIASKSKASKSALSKLQYAAAPKSVGMGGARYHSLISKYAAANGVPLKLAHAVVRVESNYRASARGRAGEIGLMQIKLATARGMGYRGSAKGLYDPAVNIRYGMKYLGKAHKLSGGSTCGTILKYNAGHGAKKMNPISAGYCRKVRRYI
jgi:soluble lytic murein transglycosylase-like protein